MTLAFLWLFLGLMLIGIPIVFVLLLAPGISLFLDDKTNFYPQLLSRLFNGMYSFPLMAIPFFILAGELMNTGGITQRLVYFAHTLIGHVRGGLAQVNISSSILFAGLSGSAFCGGGNGGVLGDWANYSAQRDHDSLRVYHERLARGAICRRDRTGVAGRFWPDGVDDLPSA